MSLKYLAIGRLARDQQGNFVSSLHEIVAFYLQSIDDVKSYGQQVLDIMRKGARKLTPDKRIRLTSDQNEYDLHVVADAFAGDKLNLVVFFAVTDSEFSKYHSVSSLLNDMKTELYKDIEAGDLLHPATDVVKERVLNLLKEVAAKYPSVKKTLQDAKEELAREIDRVAEHVELDIQQSEADAKISHSDVSPDVVVALQNVQRRNRKVAAICVLLVICILAYIIVAVRNR